MRMDSESLGSARRNQVIGFAVLSAMNLAIFHQLHNAQPEPYMDEIFHIPQAQKYCQGKFLEWDSKITTLPGLYVVSVGILNPLARLLGQPIGFLCEPVHLRLVNVALSVLTFLIMHRISGQIHGDKHYFDSSKALLSAINLSLFPLLYFFSFLYYTDVGSTFMVLLMYCLHLDGRNFFAGFIGLLSICFRQTNVVWVAFVGVQTLEPIIMHAVHAKRLEQQDKPIKFSLTTKGQVQELVSGLRLLIGDWPAMFRLATTAVVAAGGFLSVGAAFVVFVAVNGGSVVVGDRSAHAPVFHPTQILYFCLFTVGFTCTFSSSKILPFAHFCRKHYVIMATATTVVWGTMSGYSLAHPYLLADNRHYTFYVWRRILAPRQETAALWTKLALAPAYTFAGWAVLHSLRRTSIGFKIAFPAFVFVNLAPQLLLEFRYFIIPFLLYRLQLRPQMWWKLVGEFCFYVAVNLVTMYLYICKPFRWDHEPETTQRFIW